MGILTSNLMAKSNRSNYITLLQDLQVQPEDKVLEIGYGPGVGIELLANTCQTCCINGIDFSPLMYKRASCRNRKFIRNKRVKLLLGDFLNVKINSIDYDKIFCINVVYFWDNLRQPFERIKLLLKEEGVFCFYMAGRDFFIEKNFTDRVFNKYTIEEVVAALHAAGFSKVEHYFHKGYYVKAGV